jgi:hypothetical protein
MNIPSDTGLYLGRRDDGVHDGIHHLGCFCRRLGIAYVVACSLHCMNRSSDTNLYLSGRDDGIRRGIRNMKVVCSLSYTYEGVVTCSPLYEQAVRY